MRNHIEISFLHEIDILHAFSSCKGIHVKCKGLPFMCEGLSVTHHFNNTKENWHEFALKFKVIADSRGYEDIIDGTKTPLTRKRSLIYFPRMMAKC